MAYTASTGRGGASLAGYQDRENGTVWPSVTVNSDTVDRSDPWVGTVVHSDSASGPATAVSVPSVRRTQGTTWPYPKRMVRCISMVTVPRTPSTSRTTSGCSWRMGMQSMIRTVPSSVTNSDSRTSVSPR